MPVDFIVLDIDCNLSCPIILGRPFLRTIGAIIDMKEGNIKFQFPLRKVMEHFPIKKIQVYLQAGLRLHVDCTCAFTSYRSNIVYLMKNISKKSKKQK